MIHQPVSRRRRHLLKTAGAAAALGSLGFPAIVRSQAETVRIGHLTPRTGFLGPLGEYAVMGVNLAVEEINAAGGIMGRKIELISKMIRRTMTNFPRASWKSTETHSWTCSMLTF